jgi:hypothetical protein
MKTDQTPSSDDPRESHDDDHEEMKVSRYPLLKIFVFYVFVIPTLWFVLNYFVYPPSSPSAEGIALVLIGYYGYAFGMSFWSFMPPLLYRGYLRVTSKQYSKDTELLLLITGGGLALMVIGKTATS